MSSSKVWPALVKNSLNFDAALISTITELKQQQHRNKRQATNYGFMKRVRSLVSSKPTSRGCCKTGLSDIFCVTGSITAIIGCLIASFGIFPKNQVSCRI